MKSHPSCSYCSAPECDRETSEGRTYCPAHWKQIQRGKKPTPIAERLTPKQRLIEAAFRLAETETTSDDDRSYYANERALTQAARQLSGGGAEEAEEKIREEMRRAIREGMARAKERGVHVGRPPELQAKEETICRMVERVGIPLTAEALSVCRQHVWRIFNRRRVSKGTLSQHG